MKNSSMKKNADLYSTTDTYECHLFQDENEWKANRIKGIGGSDASAFVGQNKYKSNVELWKEKQGFISNDFSNELVEYGKAAEGPLRKLFELKHPEYEVQYRENCQLRSKNKRYRTYSPDGLILELDTGKCGIYEGKTSLIQNMSMYNEWRYGVPQNYFIQTLHGLLVTGFDFVVINAELRFAWDRNTEIVERYFTREEVHESLEWLDQEEDKQWSYYLYNMKPPLISNL